MISVWEAGEEPAPPDACRFCGGNDQHAVALHTFAVLQPHDRDDLDIPINNVLSPHTSLFAPFFTAGTAFPVATNPW
jgi:hypothetical protein